MSPLRLLSAQCRIQLTRPQLLVLQFIYAKEAYERVLTENPEHSKVLQQLGWLYHQRDATFTNQEMAVSYLEKSLASGAFNLD
jgi:hypothetical protein